MKLIYLHIYKDTYLIFMQGYKPLKGIYFNIKILERKIYFPKLEIFTKSEIIVLMENKT